MLTPPSVTSNHLPPDCYGMVSVLGRLQDRVPAFSARKAIVLIERELGQPIDLLFADFELQPIAAASLGQVLSILFINHLSAVHSEPTHKCGSHLAAKALGLISGSQGSVTEWGASCGESPKTWLETAFRHRFRCCAFFLLGPR